MWNYNNCQFCQRFTPKLYEASRLKDNNNGVINYLDHGSLVKTPSISSDMTIDQIS